MGRRDTLRLTSGVSAGGLRVRGPICGAWAEEPDGADDSGHGAA
jgi:hypothetical protein